MKDQELFLDNASAIAYNRNITHKIDKYENQVRIGSEILTEHKKELKKIESDILIEETNKKNLGEEIKEVNRPEILTNPLRLFQNDNPVFETLQDFIVIDQSAKIEEFQPTIFGLLEIPDINISQFVVSGTDELSLKFGPGHYIETKLPGSGGNVGIAGHRTTYGAPLVV